MGTNILISPQLLGLTGLIPLKGPKKHSGNSNGCEFRIFSVLRGTNIYKKSLLSRSIEGMTKTSIIFIGDIWPFLTDHSYSYQLSQLLMLTVQYATVYGDYQFSKAIGTKKHVVV